MTPEATGTQRGGDEEMGPVAIDNTNFPSRCLLRRGSMSGPKPRCFWGLSVAEGWGEGEGGEGGRGECAG